MKGRRILNFLAAVIPLLHPITIITVSFLPIRMTRLYGKRRGISGDVISSVGMNELLRRLFLYRGDLRDMSGPRRFRRTSYW